MKKIVPILIAFVVVALLVAKLYDTGVNRPSMMYKHIPKETSDWINQMSGMGYGDRGTTGDSGNGYSETERRENGSGLDISASPTGPFNWQNKDDYLSKPSSGMRKWGKQENRNVVVYYYKDKDAVWQGRAKSVIDCAEDAMPQLKDLFGKYYYPEDMNGRKLAVYLADSVKHYETMVRKLSGERASLGDMDESNGLLVMEVGPLGCQVRGIVLHPSCFAKGSTIYKQVLRCEMARMCFFASLDYSRQIHHFRWYSEGLAEYFSQYCPMSEAMDGDMVQFVEDKCFLDREFKEMGAMGLEAADSFFRFYADKKGSEALRDLVRLSYGISGDSLFTKVGMDTEELKSEWVESIRSNN